MIKEQELVRCITCGYETIRTNKHGEECSKCGGLVEIISYSLENVVNR